MHSLKIYYKPDNYPYWVFWKEFTQELGLIGKPSALGAGGIPTAVPGFIPRLSFGKPPNDTDVFSTNRKLRRGYEFQVKFVGTGYVILNRFRLHAQKETERSRAVNKP